MQTYEKYLFSKIEPYQKGHLKVDDIHQVYYEVSGNPNGVPIVYVHGGPGGGTSANCRRFFDPKYYKIILFDQRGCGQSTPSMELKNNTSQNLVNDMELLRNHLKINKWILFGGSWGTTLSLLYAIKYPQNVQSMVLRGVFLARQKDVDWLYYGAGEIFPDEYELFTNRLKNKQRLIFEYYHLMNSNKLDFAVKKDALLAWSRWESSLALITQKFEFNPDKDLKSHYEIALLENHFFYNNSFIEENFILNNVDKIKNIPTYIVHGKFDLICLPSSAVDLHKSLNNSQLFLIEQASHSQRDYRITKKLVEITEQLKNN